MKIIDGGVTAAKGFKAAGMHAGIKKGTKKDMVKAGAKLGYIDEERIIGEMAVGAYRAGADIYLTYFAKEIAKMMDEGKIG